MRQQRFNLARFAFCAMLLISNFGTLQALTPSARRLIKQSLSLCTVNGAVYRSDGSRDAGAVITIHRVEKAGHLMRATPVRYTANSEGFVTFTLPRGSVAYLEAPIVNFARFGGVPVQIPDAANATLATLAAGIKLNLPEQVPVTIPAGVTQPEDERQTPATSAKDGIMTAADKLKIDGLGANDPRIAETSNAAMYPDLATAIAAIGASEAVLVISDSQTVSTALIIPSNITVRQEGAGVINIADGVTLGCDRCKVEGGRRKFFNFTGRGTGVFGAASMRTANGWLPEWWGVKANDESTATQTANVTLLNKLLLQANTATQVGTTKQRGAKVNWGEGVYVFNGTVSALGYFHVEMTGSGSTSNSYNDSGRTVLRYTAAGDRFLDFRSSSSTVLRNLSIEYSNTASSLLNGGLVDLGNGNGAGTDYALIENCYIGGAFGQGIYPPENAGTLINIEYTIFSTISHNHIAFGKVGIRGGTESNSNTINNQNVFHNLTSAALRNAGENWIIDGNTFEGTAVVGGDYQFVVYDDDYKDATFFTKNFKFTNNWIGDRFHDAARPVITVRSPSGGSISNNYFATPLNGHIGTEIKLKESTYANPPSMIVISGNNFGGSPQGCGGVPCGAGIDLDNKSNAVITGNDFTFLEGNGATPVINWGQIYSYTGNNASSATWEQDKHSNAASIGSTTAAPTGGLRVAGAVGFGTSPGADEFFRVQRSGTVTTGTPTLAFFEQVTNIGNGANGYALRGRSRVTGYLNQNGTGVLGEAFDEGGGDAMNLFGVRGVATSTHAGRGSTAIGVYGTATGGATNWAGYFAGNTAITGALTLGGGTPLSKILRGTVSINPAPMAASSFSSQTFTLSGAVVGDSLTLNPPAAGLTSGLVVGQAFVSAADTITVVFFNSTSRPIDETVANWPYTLIR